MIRKRLEEFIERRIDKGPILQFVKNRPLLQKLFEDYKPQILKAGDFDNDLKREVLNAGEGEKILIFSPFTHKEKIQDILSFLKEAMKKGAKVIVQTLDPEFFSMIGQEQKGSLQRENIELLESAGIEVIRRMNMHEKAVVIVKNVPEKEGKVAYLGSTNPLSKLGSEADYMLKYTNPELVKAFYYFLFELYQASEAEAE
jgi:hypothetical protein